MRFLPVDRPTASPGGGVTATVGRRCFRLMAAALLAGTLAGCSNLKGWLGLGGSWLPGSGPSNVEMSDMAGTIPIVDVTDALARQQQALQQHSRFSQVFADRASAPAYLIGPGDMIEVSVWEAPPAVLFTAGMFEAGVSGVAHATVLPEQPVGPDGRITVPFVGLVVAAGCVPQQIEESIRTALRGKANNPQVIVRVTRNVTSSVTVVGEVGQSSRQPLTAKGERLLDVLAAANGTRNPVDKIMIQLSRGGVSAVMPLDAVIRDPSQNIMLAPGDVITALFQTNSFVALGATGNNREITFEAQGISLSQALGRTGGLLAGQSDPRGVFIFRFETPAALPASVTSRSRTPEGKIPVIYRADLKNPASFLAAQNFPILDKDVVYVSTAPIAEMQAFLSIITSSLSSSATMFYLTQ
jgi:polysaccharide export outer membrane protein